MEFLATIVLSTSQPFVEPYAVEHKKTEARRIIAATQVQWNKIRLGIVDVCSSTSLILVIRGFDALLSPRLPSARLLGQRGASSLFLLARGHRACRFESCAVQNRLLFRVETRSCYLYHAHKIALGCFSTFKRRAQVPRPQSQSAYWLVHVSRLEPSNFFNHALTSKLEPQPQLLVAPGMPVTLN